MKNTVYQNITNRTASGQKLLAVLIDPDKFNQKIIAEAIKCKVDYFFIGGSLITNGNFEKTIKALKTQSKIPVVIFPGETDQLSEKADALLFISLISGRNPELLIGKQIKSALHVKKKKLEAISTGYMIVDGGKITSAMYMSGTLPIPSDKIDIAVATAVAGEMLGLKMIYLEAGSGAYNAVPVKMIKAVKKQISIPLIIGGGITSAKKMKDALGAGAVMVVVGNALEKKPHLLKEFSECFNNRKKL